MSGRGHAPARDRVDLRRAEIRAARATTQLEQARHGKRNHLVDVDNVNVRPTGTSRAQALRRPFACVYCPGTFADLDALAAHRETCGPEPQPEGTQ